LVAAIDGICSVSATAGTQGTVSSAWPRVRGYLDTAAYGLPPVSGAEAMRAWVEQWASGSAPFTAWLGATDEARARFARLAGVEASAVATGTSVSQLAGLIAGSQPDHTRVLAPEDEFASLLFPFLAQADRGVVVELVPRDRLLEAITDDIDVIAFSAVAATDGAVAPLDAIADAAHAAGARTVVDAAQAVGWLDSNWQRFDAVITAAFKWLACPRGVAFLALTPEFRDALRPTVAGWFASEERQHFFGGPLRLAPDARRLDLAPAWSSWTAARESLDALLAVGVPAIRRHDLALADRLRRGLGRPPGASPIVVVEGNGVADRLRRAGIVCSPRPGAARLSFHLYNVEEDVDRALEALESLDPPGDST
jgi:selenocysteine lyase/cysteine desulfurase